MEKHQDWSGDKKKNERKTWARVFSVVFTGKTSETQSAAEQAWNWIVWIIAMNSWLYERKQWHPTPVLLAWKIPWTEEPGGLQSMGSLRVGHDWATSLSLFTFMHWRRKWQPTPVFLPGESQGRGAWWAAIYGVAQSQTQLKWLSSSRDKKYSEFSSNSLKTDNGSEAVFGDKCGYQ